MNPEKVNKLIDSLRIANDSLINETISQHAQIMQHECYPFGIKVMLFLIGLYFIFELLDIVGYFSEKLVQE